MSELAEIKSILLQQNQEHNEMKIQLNRMEYAILGDERIKQKGIVHKLEDLENSHYKLKASHHSHKHKFLLVAAAIGAIISAVGSAVWNKISGH